MALSLFTSVGDGAYRVVGVAGIFAAAILLGGMTLLRSAVASPTARGAPRWSVAAAWFAAFLIWQLPWAPGRAFGMTGAVALGQQLLAFTVFCSAASWRWQAQSLRPLGAASLLLLAALTMDWLAAGRPKEYAGWFDNPNIIGGLVSCVLPLVAAWLQAERPGGRAMILVVAGSLGAALLYASGCRSAVFALCGAGAAYFALPFLARRQLLARMAGVAIVTSGIALVFGYVALHEHGLLDEFSGVAQEFTGKNATTRMIVWGPLLDISAEAPWMGHGPEFLVRDELALGLSPHNLYLDILLTSGCVGLFLFLFGLAAIWNGVCADATQGLVRLAAAHFVGVAIHQSFEVAMLRNLLCIGLLQWLMLGIGLGSAFTASRASASPPAAGSTRRPPAESKARLAVSLRSEAVT